MADGENDKRSCFNCDLKVDEDGEQNWLVCDFCDNKFDTICQKISKANYNCIKREDVLWTCPNCLPRIKGLKSLLKTRKENLWDQIMNAKNLADVMKEIKSSTESILKYQVEIEKSVKTVETQVKQNMGKIDENLAKVKEIDEAKNKLWSEVVQTPNEGRQIPTPKEMYQQVKRAIYEVNQSGKDEEIRARGIVVYKLPERDGEQKEDRNEEDKETLEELLTHIGCGNAEIVYAERLGQFNAERCAEGKYRPIKVRFSGKEERDMVLKNLNRLRNAPEKLKKLSIRQDLNELQREELRIKMDEAYQLSAASATRHFIVKGGPGSYRIINVAKKFPNNFR